jgi:negative regulator of sigma E activity
MTKQLQGLCLSVDLIHNDGTTHDANDITSVTDEEDANTIDSDLNTGVLPKVEIIDSDDEGVNQ